MSERASEACKRSQSAEEQPRRLIAADTAVLLPTLVPTQAAIAGSTSAASRPCEQQCQLQSHPKAAHTQTQRYHSCPDCAMAAAATASRPHAALPRATEDLEEIDEGDLWADGDLNHASAGDGDGHTPATMTGVHCSCSCPRICIIYRVGRRKRLERAHESVACLQVDWRRVRLLRVGSPRSNCSRMSARAPTTRAWCAFPQARCAGTEQQRSCMGAVALTGTRSAVRKRCLGRVAGVVRQQSGWLAF